MKTFELLDFGSEQLRARNIKTNKLDAELLLSTVLKIKREKILINLERKIKSNKINSFNNLLKRRCKKEPMAYIINKKEFWKKTFYVDKNVLIPRPETELMIEELTKIYKNKKIYILDIGTGSGCILLSLLEDLKHSSGIGLDISKNAIEIAKKNAFSLRVSDRVKLLNFSMCKIFNKKFDLIVSNPPYIKQHELKNLQDDIKFFEPKIALNGGNDGLDLIKKVIYKTKNILKINGILALEIGNEQFNKVSKLLSRNNFKIEKIIKDYKNNIRCILSKLKNDN